MVSPISDVFSSSNPAPLAWKEFRRRSGFTTQPKVYVYDASPQIVPHSPPISALTLSPSIPNLSHIANISNISNIPNICAPFIGSESPRREHSGYLVSHVSQALLVLGASTGGNIADYISNNFCTEQGVPYEKGRKLHYMVNAILSSPKYKYLFLKDQVLKDEKRSLWRLKRPGEYLDEDTTVPPDMSIAALLPAVPEPSLDLKQSQDQVPLDPAISTLPAALILPTPTTPTSLVPSSEKHVEGPASQHGMPSTVDTLPHTVPSPSSAPLSPTPTSPYPGSPLAGDVPSLLALSSRRKKRKGSGLDSSLGIEGESPKHEEVPEEKKRRLDVV